MANHHGFLVSHLHAYVVRLMSHLQEMNKSDVDSSFIKSFRWHPNFFVVDHLSGIILLECWFKPNLVYLSLLILSIFNFQFKITWEYMYLVWQAFIALPLVSSKWILKQNTALPILIVILTYQNFCRIANSLKPRSGST